MKGIPIFREVRINLPQDKVEFIEKKIGVNVNDFCTNVMIKFCEKLETDLKTNELKETTKVEEPEKAS